MALSAWLVSLLLSLQTVTCAHLQALSQQVINKSLYSVSSTIRDTLVESSIIDDILDDFEPTYALSLSYPKSLESVQLGNDIPTSAASDRPSFEFHPISAPRSFLEVMENTKFTLVMTDPDAKSRENPKWREFCHWIITNLTLAEAELPAVQDLQSDELVEYIGPGPPPKTGKHRYVFVLLKGETTDLTAPKERKHWGYGKGSHGIRDWAEESGLKIVGANFFYAQNKEQ